MRGRLLLTRWATRLLFIVAAVSVGLVVMVVFALNTLWLIQIRGPLYTEIASARALQAEIVFPSGNLVSVWTSLNEAFLRALRGDWAGAHAALQDYEQARHRYLERYALWEERLQHSILRTKLLQEAHAPAAQLFALVEQELKPALVRADKRTIASLQARLKQLYRQHEQATGQAIALASELVERAEANAVATAQTRTRALWAIALVLLAVLSYGIFTLRQVVKSLDDTMAESDTTGATTEPQPAEAVPDSLPVDATAELRAAIERLQQGDLLYRAPVSGDDATAQLLIAYNQAAEHLSQAFAETRQTAKQVLQSVQDFIEGLNAITQNAHEVEAAVGESAQDVESLAQEIQRIAESVSQVRLAAQEVAQGAEQTAHSAAAGVERVNLITQRIQTAFVKLQQAQHESEQASQITHEGRAALQRSEQVMQAIELQTRRTAQELQQLAEMSNSVSKIVSKIEDIARQINLLALNAAIEAARAGEAGRGFAVVADEVRRLAERSALSSQEIQQILEQVVEKTREAVGAMEESLKVVQEGGAVSQQVAAGLQAILQAVDSIAEQVRHSAQLMQEVQLSSEATLSEIEQIAAIAEQSSAASEQMLASAETTTQALQQMAALSEQAAANARQSRHIVQQQVAAIQRLNQNASEASATVERLMFSLRRFRLSEEESFEERIATFKRAHLKWVERVERMVHHGEMIPRDQLVSHKKCALGTWYYSIGQQMYGHLPEFQAIEPPHERLHQIAAQAVEAVERGDRARAEQLLEEIRSVSTEIVSWLDKLYARVTTSELRQAA